MTLDQKCGLAALALMSTAAAFAFGWSMKPTHVEPDTWCGKRLYEFFLVGEKLDLVSYTSEDLVAYGTLTCKYERGLKKPE